ncbi:unnamed protein product [Diatraea saccharalis]|uniref:Uncharacterized protein n=1 Tax=Diatraea saccharalis TaxID=40085 RepID=A0A9N9QZM2_9NEOP|nr:unnamed protein product [Diatraea saccharalis]
MSSEVSLEAHERPTWLRRVAGGCARAACSQIGLVILVVVYVLLGAVLFEYLESGPEVQKRSAIQRSREECLKELWAITVWLADSRRSCGMNYMTVINHISAANDM